MTATPSTGRWQFWIDRGATFTSVVGRRPDGQLRRRRLLTANPERYPDAALRAIGDLMGLARDRTLPPDTVESVDVGTTASVNALLAEGTGEPVVMVITKGFGDILLTNAGSRRDHVGSRSADRYILHERVIEVAERVAADGAVETAPDADAVRSDLRQAFDAGFRAAAIVFLHGDRFSGHEDLVAGLARDVGFTQVSVSHEAAPVAGLAARAETTVADAYLSGWRQNLAGGVADAVGGGARLRFPRSDGTVGDARQPEARDGILSAPAAGAVAMAAIAAREGVGRTVGIDVGGVATKVSHFDGAVRRSERTLVGGVRVAAPALAVRTVAVGGGSVLHAEGDSLRVGPERAGCDPGPACFRRGGPLTMTDCLVFLGRIQPHFFPAIFGEDGDRALDAHAARTGFIDVAESIAAATGEQHKPLAVAERFLSIAVDVIAGAVTRSATERGLDITEHVLNCFGGGGGQYACPVAEAAGISRIMIHPFADSLAAYGMAMEDIRVTREQAVKARLEAGLTGELSRHLDKLEAEAHEEMSRHEIPRERVVVRRTVHLRYQGTPVALPVEFTVRARMVAAFEDAYRQRFGFALPGRGYMVEGVAVEVTCHAETLAETELQPIPGVAALRPLDLVPLYAAGAGHRAPVYNRDALLPGDTLDGPAIIAEPGAGTVVDPGWRAVVNRHGHLILTRAAHGARTGTSAAGSMDPSQTGVFAGRFRAVVAAMDAALAANTVSATAMSHGSHACAVCDSDGRLVAGHAPGSGHLGGLEESVQAVRRDHGTTLRPGDVYAHNDPHDGGTQRPEITVVTPVFADGDAEPGFFVATRLRHTDIGGSVPASMPPDSRSVDEEGVALNTLLLARDGGLREAEIEERLAAEPWPARNRRRILDDLSAQIAANEGGRQDLRRMAAHFGDDAVRDSMDQLREEAAESVRRLLDDLADGTCSLPVNGVAVIAVRVAVDKEARRATIDFTGTSAQHDGNLNAPPALCRAAVLSAIHALAGDGVPPNAGCLDPIDIVIPAGCLLNPHPPAAVAAGTAVVAPRIAEALRRALGVAATGTPATTCIAFGNDTHQHFETIGAGPLRGTDGPVDAEALERHLPVAVMACAVQGANRNPGEPGSGDGLVRRLRFTEPMTVAALACRGSGGYGNTRLERAGGKTIDLGSGMKIDAEAGDVLVVEVPGQGGGQ